MLPFRKEQPSNTINKPDNPFLPRDIILDILKRLPVKSLTRFQCVCKVWKNLIKSLSFIQLHLSHQKPSLLLKWQISESSPIQFGLLDCDMQVHEIHNLPLIDERTIGSSNGLFCVENLREDRYAFPLLLWNPATRKVREVHPRVNGMYEEDLFGFGFSQVDNDYKIVRIMVPYHRFVTSPIEVYSLNSGSWKEVEFENLEGIAIRSDRYVTVNGVMFWIGGKRGVDDGCSLILSFDLSKEVWTVIPMCSDLNYHHNKRLIECKNKLAVLVGNFGEDKSYLIHLWVMEKDTCAFGERWIWTKIFTSNPCPRLLDPMIVWRNEIVLGPVYQSEGSAPTPTLYLLNLTSNEFKSFPVRYYSHHGIPIEVFSYVENLVSIGNTNVEEVGS